MLNYDKHKEEIDQIFKDGKALCEISQTILKVHCLGCNSNKEKYTNCRIKTLEWLCQEHIEPVLTDEAKAYLKTIIKPVECSTIRKIIDYNIGTYKLDFFIKDGSITIKFKTGTKLYEYFEDMELNKAYTLKELGL